jgi:hypothetical protein
LANVPFVGVAAYVPQVGVSHTKWGYSCNWSGDKTIAATTATDLEAYTMALSNGRHGLFCICSVFVVVAAEEVVVGLGRGSGLP